MFKSLAVAMFMSTIAGEAAWADGDAAKGEKLFVRCAACHSIKDGTNKTGPTLMGVYGRPVGSVEEFAYSNAMLEFAKIAGNWDEKNLDSYLANPRGVVKGTKMSLGPMKKADERADLIAYFKSMVP